MQVCKVLGAIKEDVSLPFNPPPSPDIFTVSLNGCFQQHYRRQQLILQNTRSCPTPYLSAGGSALTGSHLINHQQSEDGSIDCAACNLLASGGY